MLQLCIRSVVAAGILLVGTNLAYAGFPVEFGSNPEWTVDFDGETITIDNDNGEQWVIEGDTITSSEHGDLEGLSNAPLLLFERGISDWLYSS